MTDVTAAEGRARSGAAKNDSDQSSAAESSVARALIYTTAEAAQLLRIGKTSLYELMATGELQSMKIGSRRLIAHQDLEAFIESRRAEGAA